MKKLLIMWALILGSILYAVSVNEEKTRIVLEANADAIAIEMNQWAEHYCDNAPECYGAPTSIPPLTFGHKLTEQIKYRFPPYDKPWTLLDLNKLAYAVSMQESKGCDSYIARMYNNCFGIRRGGKWQAYVRQEDSFADFKQLWAKYYKRFPDLALARKYSGDDRAEAWLKNVTYFYNKT